MRKRFSLCLFTLILTCASGYAATVYNESVSGDLSNNGLAPTALVFGPGSNQVLGTTGRVTATDRDYFTITVPVGYQIGQVVELGGTQVGDSVSFIGLEAGPQLTLPTNATTATGLLGWTHYGPVASETDLLPAMRVPDTGSSGFSVLPSGQYTFWIQDFGAGTFAYAFDIRLTPTPEPGTWATSLAVLILLGLAARKRQLKSEIS